MDGDMHISEEHHESHIKLYAYILGYLLFLTLITVLSAKFYHFGAWDIVVAMLIASVKAGLVGLYFMHLKYENPLIWLYVAFPIFLIFLLLGGIFIDNPFRFTVGG